MNPISGDDLIRILAGDVTRMPMLLRQNQNEISQAAAHFSPNQRVLVAASVKRVLTALLQEAITPSQAQSWASFVKRGYIPTSERVVKPINISYENQHEDVIVEALSRLDELGDAIDGNIDQRELQSLIDRLSS